MKKKFLLAAMLLSSVALSTFADDVGEASLNAVCITLKSGETKYAAFASQPKIVSSDGKLTVLSEADGQQLVVADLVDIEKITAASHDFSTGFARIDGNTTQASEIYNLDGTRATNIIPGRVYIIKSNGTTKKVIK